jgi:hypothetical protein
MAPRLKVYATHIGFHEAIVAAPNQKAALAAWDIGENLFATGAASVTEETSAVEAATAEPGVVMRRLAGSKEAWRRASEAPSLPEAPRGGRKKTSTPPPDRSRLDAAKAALRELEDGFEKAEAEFDARARALVAERRKAEADYRAQRQEVERQVREAEREFRKRGGKI